MVFRCPIRSSTHGWWLSHVDLAGSSHWPVRSAPRGVACQPRSLLPALWRLEKWDSGNTAFTMHTLLCALHRAAAPDFETFPGMLLVPFPFRSSQSFPTPVSRVSKSPTSRLHSFEHSLLLHATTAHAPWASVPSAAPGPTRDREDRAGPSPRDQGGRRRPLRAIGPCDDMNCAISGRSAVALGLKAGMRPWVGLMVATPLQCAGQRSEPPMSLPWAMAPMPAAIAAPAPPDEPPQRHRRIPRVAASARAADCR